MSVRKEKNLAPWPPEEGKKTKKKTRNFDHLYLTNGYCEFNEICCVACSAVTIQNPSAFDKGSLSYASVKIAFLFFL